MYFSFKIFKVFPYLVIFLLPKYVNLELYEYWILSLIYLIQIYLNINNNIKLDLLILCNGTPSLYGEEDNISPHFFLIHSYITNQISCNQIRKSAVFKITETCVIIMITHNSITDTRISSLE
mmetsp:Transcript_2856/g.5453  ORF Transcript_2856/g.5453 Transcript_2856/m.5453 type:complete len:122 (-) Transcript_2856:608-973(-)